MKHFKHLLPILTLLILILLSSCGGGPLETLTSSSPDGSKTVEISGTRKSPLDDIQVTIKVTAPNGNDVISLWFAGAELSDKTCNVEWEDDENGTITFTQRDDTKRVLDMKITDKIINVKEVPQEGVLPFIH